MAVGSALTAVCIGGVMRRGDVISSAFDEDPLLAHLQGHYVFELLDQFVLEVLDADGFFFVTAPHNYMPSARLSKYMTSSKRRHFQLDNRSHPRAFADRLRQGHRNTTFLPHLLQGRSAGSPFRNQLLNEQWTQCMRMVRGIEHSRGFDYKYAHRLFIADVISFWAYFPPGNCQPIEVEDLLMNRTCLPSCGSCFVLETTQVAFSRVDILWKAAHPSLSLLEETRCHGRATVWAVAADEYGGIMDKYFVLERAGASVIETG